LVEAIVCSVSSSGADDSVTTPLSLRELVGRVQSRSTAPESPDLSAQPPRLRVGESKSTFSGTARKDGRPLRLTGREFDLLAFFLANRDRAFRGRKLLEKVWGWATGDQSTVTVRTPPAREIEADPANRLIAAVRESAIGSTRRRTTCLRYHPQRLRAAG
jgi:DNA-binding response OmpR family regulator